MDEKVKSLQGGLYRSPEEAKDAQELRDTIASKKVALYSYLNTLCDEKPERLAIYGYPGKTNAEAMKMAFEAYRRDISRLIAAHIRKYPDER